MSPQAMSLSKVPILLFMAATCRRLSTPPVPMPPKEELVSSTLLDWIANRRVILQTAQAGQTLSALAEIAVILAAKFPSHPFSKHVLSTLILSSQNGDPNRIRFTHLSALGASLFIFGAVLRLNAYRFLGRFFTYQISIQRDHQLITSGPYAYVRHPSYTGYALAHLGWALYMVARGSWIRESGLWDVRRVRIALGVFGVLLASGPALVFSRIEKEDKALKDKFGKEWDEWARRVPYRLLPGVY